MSQDIHGNYWNVFRNTVDTADSAICELIDNSIDANATSIDVEFSGGSRGRFKITDNGDGCEDLEAIFRLGGSAKISGSGRYGVGAKGSMAFFGTVIDVTSVNRGIRRRVIWDTNKDITEGIWKAGMQFFPEKKVSDESGTCILITRPHTKRIAGSSIVGDLSQLLEPAIKSGIDIRYNSDMVDPFMYRWQSDCIKEDGEIFGQKYTMWAGIADSSIISDHCGWHVEKNARCLKKYINSRQCLANNDRILVRIKLHQTDHTKNEWALDPYTKAFLSDESVFQELRTRVQNFVAPLVGMLDTKKKTIRLENIRLSIKQGLNELLKGSHNEKGEASIVPGDGTDEVDVDSPAGNNGHGGNDCRKQRCVATDGDSHISRDPMRPRGIDIEFVEWDDLAYDYTFSDGHFVAQVSTKFAGSGGDAAHSIRVLAALALELYQKQTDTMIFEQKELQYKPDANNQWVSNVTKLLRGHIA